MIEICTSGYHGKSVLRQLQSKAPQKYCTEFTCEDGTIFGGELEADDYEEAEMVARALGVTVVGRLIDEAETDGVEELLGDQQWKKNSTN